MSAWLVSIETFGTRDVDISALASLTDVLSELGDVASYADGRYVARVVVSANEATAALRAARWVWQTAVADAGLPDWPILRAEVVEPLDRPDSAVRRLRRTRPA